MGIQISSETSVDWLMLNGNFEVFRNTRLFSLIFLYMYFIIFSFLSGSAADVERREKRVLN